MFDIDQLEQSIQHDRDNSDSFPMIVIAQAGPLKHDLS
jgi:hypothetical protein